MLIVNKLKKTITTADSPWHAGSGSALQLRAPMHIQRAESPDFTQT